MPRITHCVTDLDAENVIVIVNNTEFSLSKGPLPYDQMQQIAVGSSSRIYRAEMKAPWATKRIPVAIKHVVEIVDHVVLNEIEAMKSLPTAAAANIIDRFACAYTLNEDEVYTEVAFIQELFDCDLQQYLSDHSGRQKVEDVTNLCHQVVEAFKQLVSQGFMPLDFKPGNFLVDRSSRTCKLADFGDVYRVDRLCDEELVGLAYGKPTVTTPNQRAPEVTYGKTLSYELLVSRFETLASPRKNKALATYTQLIEGEPNNKERVDHLIQGLDPFVLKRDVYLDHSIEHLDHSIEHRIALAELEKCLTSTAIDNELIDLDVCDVHSTQYQSARSRLIGRVYQHACFAVGAVINEILDATIQSDRSTPEFKALESIMNRFHGPPGSRGKDLEALNVGAYCEAAREDAKSTSKRAEPETSAGVKEWNSAAFFEKPSDPQVLSEEAARSVRPKKM